MYLSREDVVQDFHTAFGHPVSEEMTPEGLALRFRLIAEEYGELKEEMAAALTDLAIHDKVSVRTKARLLKELADLQYVLSGMAVTFGLPLQVAFTRVHKSNMSKLGEDGKPVLRDDGKILKGPNYIPPDLEDLVEPREVPGYEYYGTAV